MIHERNRWPLGSKIGCWIMSHICLLGQIVDKNLWYLDLLLGSDHEISSYTTAVVK
jgi:hypothetical protein